MALKREKIYNIFWKSLRTLRHWPWLPSFDSHAKNYAKRPKSTIFEWFWQARGKKILFFLPFFSYSAISRTSLEKRKKRLFLSFRHIKKLDFRIGNGAGEALLCFQTSKNVILTFCRLEKISALQGKKKLSDDNTLDKTIIVVSDQTAGERIENFFLLF